LLKKFSLNHIRVIVFFSFLLIYSIIYVITTYDEKKRIEHELNQQILNLSHNYDVTSSRFSIVTRNVSYNIFNNKKILNILYQAKHTQDKIKRLSLRKELYEEMHPLFGHLKQFGVIMVLFSFEDNISFLRVHKPDKFDDDLSKVRYSFTYVNSSKKPITGFEQGKIAHAFRNIYPIFYKDEYLGSVDIAFSSQSIQENMKAIHGVDTHFILNKSIFDSNIWKAKKKIKYIQSIEHDDFLFSLTHSQNTEAFSKYKLDLTKSLKKEIAKNIKHSGPFALYKNYQDNTYILAFSPVKNIKDKKTVAYLVSYSKNRYIKNTIDEYTYINISAFFALLLLAFITNNNIKHRFYLKEIIKNKTKELEQIASTDKLTGIYNRHKFEELFSLEQERSKRSSSPLSLMLIDIDHFKSVNDTYGHDVGDAVLIELTKILNENIRKIDIFARWGGEEFLILSPETDTQNIQILAEKLRLVVENSSFDTVGKITISIGISELCNNDLFEDLFKRADNALYKAKEKGRNQLVVE